MLGKAKRYRPRTTRHRFTINNPILADVSLKVLDPDNMTPEQKELYERNIGRNDFDHFKTPEYEKFFEFAICEYDQREYGDTFSKVIAERIFFKSYEMACEYFKTIDFIDYVCFQYEQGALMGTKHLQGFMHYYKAMDFNLVKAIFPTMHLNRCDDNNSECIAYCRKEETKIAEYPFFSHGVVPADERARTDMTEYMNDILSGMSKIELLTKYPHITMQMYNKISQIQQDNLHERYKNYERDIHVTYIYGKADVGKTTYPRRVLGIKPADICKVNDYGSGKFDEYNGHDIILFDEFLGQIPLTKMNDYLDGQPSTFLPARYANKVACYTKAFVISNYPLDEQYKKDRTEKNMQPSFDGFVRRIHEIIHIPERNVYIWQKGRPTDETIAKLETQGAKITLLPEIVTQTTIGGNA